MVFLDDCKIYGKYTIKKFEDFKKFSSLKIDNIIITNKYSKEGYLKLKDDIGWFKLYHKKYFKNESYETLKGFLTTNKYYKDEYGYLVKINNTEQKIIDYYEYESDVVRYVNKDDKHIINQNEYDYLSDDESEQYIRADLYKSKMKELKFNIDEIIKDICNKTYTEHPPIYDFKEYEYIMLINNTHYIFNAFEKKYSKLDDYNKNNIIFINKLFRPITALTLTNINIDIVQQTLELIIKDKIKIKEFQKLAYNLYVKKTSDEIIFYDYYYTDPILIDWINDIYLLLVDDNILYSNYYYNEPKYYNKLIKEKNYRYVIIDINDNRRLNTKINYFRKLGITNFIIKEKTPQSKSIYKDLDEFTIYLNENKHLYTPYLIEKDESKINFNYPGNIFFKKNLLFLNFLTWICSYTE